MQLKINIKYFQYFQLKIFKKITVPGNILQFSKENDDKLFVEHNNPPNIQHSIFRGSDCMQINVTTLFAVYRMQIFHDKFFCREKLYIQH